MLFVSFLLVVVVPLEILLSIIGTRFDEFFFLGVRDFEIDGTHSQTIDVDGALPVVAVQVYVVLEVDKGGDQGLGIGE